MTSTGFKVTFPAVKGAEGYQIQRRSGSGSWKTLTVTLTTAGGKLSFESTGLTSGSTYQFRIRAKAASGDTTIYSTYQQSASVLMLRAPKAPTTANSNTGLKVSWTKVTGAEGYKLQRKSGSADWKTIKTIASGSTVSYTDQSVTEGVKYQYRLIAVSGNTSSVASSSDSGVHMKKPSITTAKAAGKSSIKVTWKKVSKATGYQLSYSTSSDFSKAKTVTVTGTASTISKTINSLKANTKYYVRLRTYKTISDVRYYSNWSSTKTVKTEKK